MWFYFLVHTFLGILLASSNLLLTEGKANIHTVPSWVHRIGPPLTLFLMGSCIAAIFTTLVNYSLIWMFATVAEMALGTFIAGMLPMGLRAFIVVTSPISVIFILGNLWKFWYI